MALFIFYKLILQTRMHSHPVGLDVWFLVGPFIYFYTSRVRTAKALARLRRCTGSPEPSLVAYLISSIISWAGSFYFNILIADFLILLHTEDIGTVKALLLLAVCKSSSDIYLLWQFLLLYANNKDADQPAHHADQAFDSFWDFIMSVTYITSKQTHKPIFAIGIGREICQNSECEKRPVCAKVLLTTVMIQTILTPEKLL